MAWKILSGVCCVLAFWAAYLQLNDPDPERWFAMYAACGVVAALCAAGRGNHRLAGLVGAIALAWALAIVPELLGHWTPADLGARMSAERPEVEFGRELGGLLIMTTFCAAAFFVERRRAAGRPPR